MLFRKNLLKNKYFQDGLIVNGPIWLHKRKTRFFINKQNEIVLFEPENSKLHCIITIWMWN